MSLHTPPKRTVETYIDADGLAVASHELNEEVTERTAITGGVSDESAARLGFPVDLSVNKKQGMGKKNQQVGLGVSCSGFDEWCDVGIIGKVDHFVSDIVSKDLKIPSLPESDQK